MQSIKNLVSKRRSAVMTESAPASARPSEDKTTEKTLAEHHEGSLTSAQHLSPHATDHHHAYRGHRRNISEATAATSARSSMDITPADAAEAGNNFPSTNPARDSRRRVSQQIDYENSLPGMNPPMARTVDRAGRQGFTSSGIMGYEGLGHDVL